MFAHQLTINCVIFSFSQFVFSDHEFC